MNTYCLGGTVRLVVLFVLSTGLTAIADESGGAVNPAAGQAVSAAEKIPTVDGPVIWQDFSQPTDVRVLSLIHI